MLRAETVLGIGVSALVAVLVLPPLIAVMVTGVGAGFAPLRHTDLVLNTLLFGLLTTLGALVTGGALALALGAGVPGRTLLERLVVMPLYLTPLLTAMGWNWLGSPRSGLLNLLLHAAFGPHVTLDIVSPAGAMAVAALATAPLPFLLISDALRGLDPALLEAARVHGAMPARVFRRVTLPLLLPAGLAAAMLVFVQAIGLFSVPAVLGMPAGFYVATTEIYRLLESYPPRIADATAWGMLLLAIAALLTFTQSALLGRRSFVTITGKAFRPNLRSPAAPGLRAALAWLYVALATVLPLLALLWAASSAFVTADFRLMRFTAAHFAFVLFGYPKTWLAVGNSVLLGVLTASLVCLLGLAVSWVVLRARQAGRGVLDQLSMLPLSMPAMVFALGLLWVYVRVRLPIYGTIGILLLAYCTHYLPFGVRTSSAALRQLHPELEEAARVAGASWLRTMRRITFPLVQPAVLAAWVLLFVMAMQEVSSSILLYTSRSIVLSVAVFDLWENGNPSDVAALGFLQLAASFIVVSLVLGLRQRRGVT
ncbi:MAG: iron ABC transporter permease [Acidisphaera sp.]|nr:iron ABC transporter permease [Acidisphaera sp.]